MSTAARALAVGSIEPLVESFVRHLRASNKSLRTQEGYAEACTQFARFIDERGMPSEVDHLRREHVEAFIEDLLNRFKPATANNRYRALQQFFKWLVDEGEIVQTPMAKMKPPKVPEPITPVLSVEQIQKLIATCDSKTFEGRRDEAIIRVIEEVKLRRKPFTEEELNDSTLNGIVPNPPAGVANCAVADCSGTARATIEIWRPNDDEWGFDFTGLVALCLKPYQPQAARWPDRREPIRAAGSQSHEGEESG